MRTTWKRVVCVLLPNKQHLECTVGVRARGREVMNSVLKQLGLTDLQVFALSVVRDNEYLFLDLDQKLSKYFDARWKSGSVTVPFILFLRVLFYVENGRIISNTKVRQLYYTELRQKVLQSQSHHQEASFFLLAASALQAEVGDLEPTQRSDEEEEEKKPYFLPEDYFPSWMIKRRGRDFLLRNCPTLHSELRGVSHSRAMLSFIKEANELQDVAVSFYRMRQGRSFEISAVGSLCLPKLQYYTHSAFQSKHILRHLTDTHRFHMDTRQAVGFIQQLEDMHACRLYNEAYICDNPALEQTLQSNCLTLSKEEEEEEDEGSTLDVEQCLDESEEVFVDDPAEVSWLADLFYGTSVDGALVLPASRSHWAVVTMEMKQVVCGRVDEGMSVD
ncbi:FERM domain-containing protein 1 isoform X3 [Gouania willdenowi]|uniref:FERM domain-containing protein 1 isoform X3 n=1 Tax=Gouania willdenowi TaxID=441366 RepID=UPI00105621CA|nr:FERM domain-containing protein 1-like isoform X3 [Gouania willdenowi]